MRRRRGPVSDHLRRRRSARGAVLNTFFVTGAALGTWLSLIPAVQQKLALHPGELGIALLGLAIGAVVATSSTGWLVGRAGGWRVATLAMTMGCAILFLLPMVPNVQVLTLSLFIFGAALGTVEVAMNIEGAVVESMYRRPLMSTFHGFNSTGAFAGAAVSSALAAIGLSPGNRAVLPAVVLGAAALVGHRWLPVDAMQIAS